MSALSINYSCSSYIDRCRKYYFFVFQIFHAKFLGFFFKQTTSKKRRKNISILHGETYLHKAPVFCNQLFPKTLQVIRKFTNIYLRILVRANTAMWKMSEYLDALSQCELSLNYPFYFHCVVVRIKRAS